MTSQHRLARWPAWVTRWLGFRATPPPKPPQYVVWVWSFIGAFGGLAVLQAIFGHVQYFIGRGVPSVIASYGASAVLCYGSIEAPLAQPRALVFGHFISALTGVCITKLFSLLHDPQRFDELRWLAGCLATATSIVAMQITETTHPPAGATALLAAVNAEITDLGWYYLPVVLLSSMLILVVSLIVNNIQRRYPVFWFKPAVAIPAKPSPALGGEDSTATSSSVGPTKTESMNEENKEIRQNTPGSALV